METARHSGRYDRLAGNYSQVRPRYPDALVAYLAGVIAAAPAAPESGLVLDIGSGTGAFTRQLRSVLPAATRIIGVEPGAALRQLAAAHHIDACHVRFGYLFQCITVRRDP